VDDRVAIFADAGFVVLAMLESAFAIGLTEPLPLTEPFAERGDLRAVFVDLDFDLLIAIWISLMSTTASGAATNTSPVVKRGERSSVALTGPYRLGLANVDTVALCRPGKSSEFGAILWLFYPECGLHRLTARRVSGPEA
jgi:hypothetical protein